MFLNVRWRCAPRHLTAAGSVSSHSIGADPPVAAGSVGPIRTLWNTNITFTPRWEHNRKQIVHSLLHFLPPSVPCLCSLSVLFLCPCLISTCHHLTLFLDRQLQHQDTSKFTSTQTETGVTGLSPRTTCGHLRVKHGGSSQCSSVSTFLSCWLRISLEEGSPGSCRTICILQDWTCDRSHLEASSALNNSFLEVCTQTFEELMSLFGAFYIHSFCPGISLSWMLPQSLRRAGLESWFTTKGDRALHSDL